MKRIVLSLSIVAAVAGCSRAGATPGDTVQQFTMGLENGQCVGIKDMIAKTGSGIEGSDVGDRIERVCTRGVEERRKIPVEEQDRERLKQVNILDTQENGDSAVVKIEFETRAGEKLPPQQVALLRQDGRWRIDLEGTRRLAMTGLMPQQAPSAPPAMSPPATPPSQPTPAPVPAQ